jgi:ketosteroid isomerase-like protein
MVKSSSRDIIERFTQAIEAQDFDTIAALVADDYVEDYPQSGERIRGRANQQAILRNFPGGVGTVDPDSTRLVGAEDRWVVTPAFTVQRIEGSGDTYFYVASARYPNGETWQIDALVELRDGKIARRRPGMRRPSRHRLGAPRSSSGFPVSGNQSNTNDSRKQAPSPGFHRLAGPPVGYVGRAQTGGDSWRIRAHLRRRTAQRRRRARRRPISSASNSPVIAMTNEIS